MLKKLIKHDYKALSKTLWPAQIAIVCATLIATGSTAAYTSWASKLPTDGALGRLAQIILVVVPVIMLLGVIAAAFVVAFIIFNRFYKNLMGDEGYLSFTLPVTATSHLWAKLITAVIWLVISTVVILLCVMLFSFVSAALAWGEFASFIDELKEGLRRMSEFWQASHWVVLAEFILISVVAAANTVLHIYLSITIGSLVAKKHKILAAIGFYFIISTAVGILSSIFTYGITSALIRNPIYVLGGPDGGMTGYTNAMISIMHTTMLSTTALMALLAAAYFIVTRYLLKNKLNLD